MSQTRQLAAIMFTDIVGYTALIGNDEQMYVPQIKSVIEKVEAFKRKIN